MGEHSLDETYRETRSESGPNIMMLSPAPHAPSERYFHATHNAMTIATIEGENGSSVDVGTFSLKCDDMRLYISVNAEDARDFAAAFVRIADLLDGGKGKQ